jgi:hypothetical protein
MVRNFPESAKKLEVLSDIGVRKREFSASILPWEIFKLREG